MAISQFAELYRLVQGQQGTRIHKDFLFDAVETITGEKVKVCCSAAHGLNTEDARGFFLSVNHQQPHQRIQFNGKHLILFARGMNRCWNRFIQIKELMHLFDHELMKTSTGEELEQLLNCFAGTTKPEEITPPFVSDHLAIWMALMVLCTERNRAEFSRLRSAGQITDLEIATQLRIPEQVIPMLCHDTYKVVSLALLNP